jgi:hypothetical protein
MLNICGSRQAMTIVALPDGARRTATGVQEQHIEAAGMRHGRLNVLSCFCAAVRTAMQGIKINLGS